MGTEEEEEEEYLVHVEFDSLLDSETFQQENLFFKVIGIDSEKPIMQIGDQVFFGQYRDIAGTSLFFEEDDEERAEDPVFAKTAKKTLSYKYKTRKALVMRRVFIKRKGSSNKSSSTENENMEDEERVDQMNLSHHIMDSESLLGSELGMEISGINIKDELCFPTKNMQCSPEKQPKLDVNSCSKSTVDNTKNPVKCRNKVEPVAGPSWAPDISPVDCDEMFEELPTSTVNADEMSRLIVEQMTLESDIKMQNFVPSTKNVD